MAEVFCPINSRIKMQILTKHDFENLTWYSPLKQNRWQNQRIIDGMIRRFKKQSIAAFTNVLQFYENKPGSPMIYRETIK